MGLFTLLAYWWKPIKRRENVRLDSATFSPHRLERRRVLDAAGVGVVLDTLADPSDFVQVGEYSIENSSDSEAPLVSASTSTNSPPNVLAVIPFAPNSIEGTTSNLILVQFSDPDIHDTHTVVFDWGDGTPEETFTAGPGNRFLFATHIFQDDNPTKNPVDLTEIKVKVIDSAGQESMGSTTVTVSNVDPSIDTLSINSPVNEGNMATLAGTFSDPGTLDTFELDIDWDGDNNFDQTITVSGGSFSVSRQFLDDPNPPGSDTFNVNVQLRDDDMGSDTDSLSVTINNVPPTLLISGDSMVDEGSIYTLSLSSMDPGDDTISSWEINWGDGTVEVLAGNPSTATHTYADDGPYDISATATDEDGTFASNMISVSVKNVPPTLLISGDSMVDEGSVYTLSLSSMDPGDDTISSWEINWGDGTVEVLAGNPSTATHTYADDGPYDISATATDEDGTFASNMISVSVKNVPPTLLISGDSMVDEGSVYTLSLSSMDPGDDTISSWEINWGDGTVEVLAGNPSTATHTYADDGPYDISATATDEDGTFASNMISVSVKNVPPTLLISGDSMVDEGSVYTLSLSSMDPGDDTISSWEINWGDGTVEVLAGNPSTATHTYADDGPYDISATATDEDGTFASNMISVSVKNVPPVVSANSIMAISENGFSTLTGTYTEPGILDAQILNVDWNDPNNILNSNFEIESLFKNDMGVLTQQLFVGDTFASTTVGDSTLLEITSVDVMNGVIGFRVSHQYVDDGLSGTSPGMGANGTSSDESKIVVTLSDDDGGMTDAMTTLTVENVEPILSIDLMSATISENGSATLIGLITDSGRLDTHHLTIDWSDPNNSLESMFDLESIFSVDISTGVLTQQLFVGDTFASTTVGDSTLLEITSVDVMNGVIGFRVSHQYVDDGLSGTSPGMGANGTSSDESKIVVTLSDDDGGMTDAMTTLTVENVSPEIMGFMIDRAIINESESISLSGRFEDVGLEDFHSIEIRWGDGKVDAEGGDLIFSQVVSGEGTFSATHTYLDNDTPNIDDAVKDNIYTIEITITDDDGETATQTYDLTVLNVNPVLQPIAQTDATDINTQGDISVTITFSDLGADELFVWVDWGDIRDPNNPFLPGSDPFVQESVAFNPSGVGTFTITLMHRYSGPPNPLNPSGDVDIFVVIVDDDFDLVTAGQVDGPLTGQPLMEPGRSEFQMVTVSNPGIGNTPIRIDTTPQVPRLTFPVRTEGNFFLVTTTSSESLTQGAELRAAAGDTKSTNERILQLQVVSSTGEYSEPIRLKSEVLNNLPGLFRKLTNNHFVITLKRTETNSTRLVIEFFIRNGKAVNPDDDSDGTLELPPTDESQDIFLDPQDQNEFEYEETPEVKNDPTSRESDDISLNILPEEIPALSPGIESASIADRSSRQHYSTAIAALLALSRAGNNWAEQVDRSFSAANPQKWRQLRSHLRHSRKNR